MVQLFFPDFFFAKQLPDHHNLKKYILEKELVLTKPKDWVGQVETTRNLMHNKDFKPLLDAVSITAKECFNEYSVKKELTISFPPDAVWLNRYSLGMWQEYHTHSERASNFSFVYFVDYNPKTHGKFTIWNDRYEQYALSGITNILNMDKLMIAQNISLDILEGDLIIFPSFYKHAVTMQNVNDYRVTIAGNFLLS